MGGKTRPLLYRRTPKCAGRANNAEFMLQATVPSVETKTSWVVASHDSGGHGGGLRRAVDNDRRAQGHCRRGQRRALRPRFCRRADVDRGRGRRHPDGPRRRTGRRPLDGDFRCRDDCGRARGLHAGSVLAALYRARSVHRLVRHRRHQCAVVCLCQPLVRPPARLGAGADFERIVSRRRDLAADIRPRHRLCRVAAHHAVLCRLRASDHCACGSGVSRSAAGCGAPRRASGYGAQAKIGAGLAAEFGLWLADGRDLYLLHPDVDAARRISSRSAPIAASVPPAVQP